MNNWYRPNAATIVHLYDVYIFLFFTDFSRRLSELHSYMLRTSINSTVCYFIRLAGGKKKLFSFQFKKQLDRQKIVKVFSWVITLMDAIR